MREVEHRGGGEVQPDAAKRAAPVHAHLRGFDVRDERAQQRDGDQREVPADDERQRGAQQEPGEADGPVEVPPGGAPRGRLGQPERERREVERGVRGEKANAEQRRHQVERPDHGRAQAKRHRREERRHGLAFFVDERRSGEEGNRPVHGDGVEHPRRADQALQRLRQRRDDDAYLRRQRLRPGDLVHDAHGVAPAARQQTPAVRRGRRVRRRGPRWCSRSATAPT